MPAALSSKWEVRQSGRGRISDVFVALFWVHQVVLGLPSVAFGLELLFTGRVEGIVNVIGFFLAWIGGTLAFGLAVLMHRKASYVLPAAFDELVDHIARLETMQRDVTAKSAVASAIGTSEDSC